MTIADAGIRGLVSSLADQRRALDVTTKDIAGASDAQRVRRVVEMRASKGGAQLVHLRDTDEFAVAKIRQLTAGANRANEVTRITAAIDNIFGDVQTEASFDRRLNSVFANFTSLAATNSVDPSAMVGNLREATEIINSTAGSLLEVSGEVERSISATCEEVNQQIQDLFKINHEIANTFDETVRFDLHDIRDDLLYKLAANISVEVSFQSDGRALVRSGDKVLLDEGYYAELSYAARGYTELSNGAEAPAIMIKQLNSNGKAHNTTKIENLQSLGGRIGGLAVARDEKLPDALNAVNAVATAVIEQGNKLHHQYASMSESSLRAATQVRDNDFVKVAGKVRVSVLDKDGKSVSFSGGGAVSDSVRHVDVDLSAISSFHGQGNVTVHDLLGEVTKYFSHDVRVDTVSMGAIENHEGENLLNDLQLIGLQNVTADGRFSFDLDLDNSSHFNSKIEILSAEVDGGAASTSLLPTVELSAGQRARAGANIAVQLTPGALSTINLKVRVTGENGQVAEGVVAYEIDLTAPANNAQMNKRLKGIPGAASIGGGFVARQDYMPTLLQTKMVDGAGTEVTDGNKPAYAVLETISDQYSIVIEDLDSSVTGSDGIARGFGHFFGFNNMFELTVEARASALTMSVADHLLADNSRLASTKLRANMQIGGQYKVGSIAASESIEFTDPNNTYLNGVKVTINGEELTIGTDCTAGVSINASLRNLASAINANPRLKDLVLASVDGDKIIVTAQKLGTSGNTIAIRFDASIDAQIDGTFEGALAENNAGGHLKHGTDENQYKTFDAIGWTALRSNDFARKMADFSKMNINFAGSSYVNPSSSTTLGAVITRTQLRAVQEHTAAQHDAEVSKGTMTALADKFMKDHGVNKDELWIEVNNRTQLINLMSNAMMLIQRLNEKLIDTITR